MTCLPQRDFCEWDAAIPRFDGNPTAFGEPRDSPKVRRPCASQPSRSRASKRRSGARVLAPALEVVPRWLGLHEEPWELPAHPVVDRLMRDHSGLRLNDSGDVYRALVPAILQQRITWEEAAFLWRRVVETLGEAAPGPADLRLAPTPSQLRSVGVARLVQLGVARQQARTLHEVAFLASRLQRAAKLPTSQAAALLQKVAGIGPWTTAVALGGGLGRPEPIVLGDLHLPNTVAWALAREPRGTDERMQELLAPFAGQCYRVIRLLLASGIRAPRRGPRRPVFPRR